VPGFVSVHFCRLMLGRYPPLAIASPTREIAATKDFSRDIFYSHVASKKGTQTSGPKSKVMHRLKVPTAASPDWKWTHAEESHPPTEMLS